MSSSLSHGEFAYKEAPMQVTARAEYACLAMMELAVRYGSPHPIRLTEITEKQAIPDRFLVQILLQMKTAGLVSTTRGKAGGYHLARTPDKITLADIIGALARLEEPTEPHQETPSPFAQRLQKIWHEMAQARMKMLGDIRLADLIVGPDHADYMI